MEKYLSKLKAFFSKTVRKKPSKLWFFYREPYLQGLGATGLIAGAIILIVTVIFLLGCLGFSVIAIFGVVVIFIAYALVIGLGLTGLFALGEGEGAGIVVVVIMGGLAYLLGSVILQPVHSFVGDVFGFAGSVYNTLAVPFFGTLNFISVNWLALLLLVLSPAIVVLTFAFLTLLTVGSLYVFEKGVLTVYGINYTCPVCAKSTEPAQYYCPACKTAHPVELVPNQYGILRHHCTNCQEPLPTMMLLGRNKNLQKSCTHCNNPLGSTVGIDKHIGIVGPRKSGKTCFLVQGTHYLIENFGAEIPEDEQKRDYRELQDLIQTGQVPPQTQMTNLHRAFQVEFGGKKFPYHVYLYDIAGENYEHVQDVSQFPFFQALNSIVFLLDPYSSIRFRKDVGLPDGLVYATQEPSEVFASLRQVLEKFNDAKRIQKIQFNVVLVKSDLGYLDHLRLSGMLQDQVDQTLRQFVMDQLDEESFVHAIEQSFQKIHYHYLSPLGRNPSPDNQHPFQAAHLKRTMNHIFRDINIKINN